jgi:ubiquinone/menaquinone biosynthesis C-methylase UbiE
MEQWYFRYSQQATWTKSIREKLFHQAGLNSTTKILDVGCGPGVLLNELNVLGIHSIHGLDIAHEALSYAKLVHPLNLAQGNALRLPYDEQSFDIVFCHFLLLWIKDPGDTSTWICSCSR